LGRHDGVDIEGEFSARWLREFVPKPRGKLEEEQTKWLKDNPESKESEAARTPLFARREHGIGDKEQVGWKPEAERRSAQAHS
jgi:hypothetical protein